MIETLPAKDTAPELFGVARRTQVAAAGTVVKPAAAEIARVNVAASQASGQSTAQSAVSSAAAQPVQIAQTVPKPVPVKAPAKLAGAPIHLVDASGSPDAARRLGLRLTRLGWSIQTEPASGKRAVEASSRIDYPARNPQIAQALAHTLPGAVRVHACAGACPAIRLVVGKDARAWSPPKKVMSRT